MDLAILFPSTSTLIPTANFSFLPSRYLALVMRMCFAKMVLWIFDRL